MTKCKIGNRRFKMKLKFKNVCLYSLNLFLILFVLDSAIFAEDHKENPCFSPGFLIEVADDISVTGPEPLMPPMNWPATGKNGMVASANPVASKAGVEMLKAGGNAIDALLAVQWALNVVEPQSSGIGGGAFIIYHEAKTGKVYAFDGREEAPAASDPKMFYQKNGKPIRRYPDRMSGGLAVGIPGTVAVMEYVKKRFGSKKVSFAQTFEPAIRCAERGIRTSPRLSLSIKANFSRLAKNPEAGKIFLNEGRPFEVGEVLYQKDLAGTFKTLAQKGANEFYKGTIANDIVGSVHNNPFSKGRMQKSDLEAYRPIERSPIKGSYRGHTLYTMPPPSSGIIMLQALALLDDFSNKDTNLDTVTGAHLKLQAERLAFADREFYIADPDYGLADVSGLLDPNYIAKRRALITKGKIKSGRGIPGEPPGVSVVTKSSAAYNPGTDTTHISIIDAEGNAVSCTATIEHGFGSGVVVKGRGFLLNNQLTDFSIRSGYLNSLEGGRKKRKTALNPEALETSGGKRPRSSMSPTLVFKDRQILLSVGSPGGSKIPGSVGSVIMRFLNEDMNIGQAINAPRVLHRYTNSADLEVYYHKKPFFIKSLTNLGHEISKLSTFNQVFGGVQGVSYDAKTKIYWGAGDRRREGAAVAVVPYP